jgi:hypothetical protein
MLILMAMMRKMNMMDLAKGQFHMARGKTWVRQVAVISHGPLPSNNHRRTTWA